MKRVLVIPEPISVIAASGARPRRMSLQETIGAVLRTDSRFGESLETLEILAHILEPLGAAPGAQVLVEERLWLVAAEALRRPTIPYLPDIGLQILPHLQHFVGAAQSVE